MYDVITVGSATKDVYFRSKFKIISDEKSITGKSISIPFGSKLKLNNILFETGGGGTNTSVGFSRLGLKTACICKVGDDSAGDHIVEELKKEKVDISFVIRSISREESETGYSAILEDKSGERTILLHSGANANIKKREIDFSKLKTKWIHLAPLHGESINIIDSIVKYANDNKIKISINPSANWLKKRKWNILKKCDVVILNLEEGKILTKETSKGKIFQKLYANLSGIIVLTMGKEGCIVSDHKKVYDVGIYRSKVIDTLGAGDSFSVGLIYGLITEKTLKTAINYGNLNATSVLKYVGAKKGLLRKTQLKRFEDNLGKLYVNEICNRY